MRLFTPIFAIFCITFLTGFALSLGYNGAILAGACAIIGGLGGYAATRKKPPTNS